MTNPNDIPPDVARKLLAIRDALIPMESDGVGGLLDEAYHQLYSIADPEFKYYHPWEILEQRAKLP